MLVSAFEQTVMQTLIDEIVCHFSPSEMNVLEQCLLEAVAQRHHAGPRLIHKNRHVKKTERSNGN